MKKVFEFYIADPARFFLLTALLWGGFMCFLNYKDGADFSWHDLLVEANGMVFDLLVFGVLLYAYEAWREKRDKIERLREEIDDYRGWNEKEATFRIVGAVRRLNKLGVKRINLKNCYLKQADLEGINLEGTHLFGANLEKANLIEANLKGAILVGANLKEATLIRANLESTQLFGANLERAILSSSNLEGAFFWNTTIEGTVQKWTDIEGKFFDKTNLYEATLGGAKVGKGWFEGKDGWEIWGMDIIKEKYLIDEDGFMRVKEIKKRPVAGKRKIRRESQTKT